jgi:hypothetical protein
MHQKFLLFCFLSVLPGLLIAQNVGIGTGNPLAKLQVEGSFSVKSPTSRTSSAATPAQTHTMVNGVIHNFLMTDSVGRIYDPGGPGGNYLPNLSSGVYIPIQNGFGTYLEITLENISLGTGDSLIIHDGYNDDPVLYKVGNGFNGSNIVVSNFNNYGAFVAFKSNGDAGTGSGFSLLFKKVYVNNAVPDPSSQLSGSYLNFYPVNAALRSGSLSGAAIGEYSTAMGNKCEASGYAAFAAGLQSSANSYASVAMGASSESSGGYSVAVGFQAKATGLYSTAIGYSSFAKGTGAICAGRLAEANGNYSFAVGNATDALGDYSVASGFISVARGNISTAFGQNTLAKSYASMALGRYNDTLATENGSAWQATDRVFVIGDGTGNTARSSSFYLLKNGNGWMQGTLTQASDARLKKDIAPLKNVLPRLVSLSGYNYNWKDDKNMPGLQAGFIAQEVQALMPELVTSNTEGQLAVNYSGMLPYLLEGIKEQQQVIKNLQEQINQLKKIQDEQKKYQRSRKRQTSAHKK